MRVFEVNMFWDGLFHVALIEGLIDHHLLGIHHVVENASNHLPADLAFLASGVVLIVLGWGMIRRTERVATAVLRRQIAHT